MVAVEEEDDMVEVEVSRWGVTRRLGRVEIQRLVGRQGYDGVVYSL